MNACRAAVVVAGIVLGQVLLYGPSLAGHRILLPLDVLAEPGIYLPRAPGAGRRVARNTVLADAVLTLEPGRRFAAAEIRAGRLPLWNPYSFTGAPFAVWATYSPYHLLSYAFPSPVTLAWVQLLKSLVAGVGAYLFFRRVLRVRHASAAVGAWCYPLCGVFSLWQAYPVTFVLSWLPWLLLASECALRRPRGWGGPALAVLVGLAFLSGQLDVAALMALAVGSYSLWRWAERRVRARGAHAGVGGLATLAGAWAVGLALAAPYWLPLAQYGRTGARIQSRVLGMEERPPTGAAALPQMLLPEAFGSHQRGSFRLLEGNRLESSAQAYTGLLATLVLAPLALGSRRHRSLHALWCALGVLSLGWVLDLPGLVWLERQPPLNLLSYSRFVFVAAFACLCMAVVGGDRLWRGRVRRRPWFWLPATALLALLVWSLHAALVPPEPIARGLAAALERGKPHPAAPDRAAVEAIRAHFKRDQLAGAGLCAVGVLAWIVAARRPRAPRWLAPALAAATLTELVGFARGQDSQSDPALYYPKIPVLAELARATPGRMLGLECLPPMLALGHGLRDLRGYDGVDPLALVELLRLVAREGMRVERYAYTMYYRTPVQLDASGQARLAPLLDMLNLRYLVARGDPPEGIAPRLTGDDYWVVENPRALPRVWVPRRAAFLPDADGVRERLARPDFDAREVAFVDRRLELPDDARGEVEVTDEQPGRIRLRVDMQTPGLVVLSDLWHPGWRARLDGGPAPVLRTNHALRGVVVPAGSHELVFRYAPAGVRQGFAAALAGGVALLAWAALVRARTGAGAGARAR